MLIASIAELLLSVTYWPIIPEEPSTLELVVAAAATLGVYSLAGRYVRQRRARTIQRLTETGDVGVDSDVRKAA